MSCTQQCPNSIFHPIQTRTQPSVADARNFSRSSRPHARFLFFRLVPLSFLTRASCKRDLIPRILVFKARVFLYGRFQKSKGCAAVRALASHQFGPGSNPGVDAIRGLSLLLVFSLASRDFSPGFPVFPSPQKPALPDSNSILNARTH